MIEINLLPGAGKKSKAKGAGIDLGAKLAGLGASVKNPYMLGSVGMVVVGAVALAGMMLYQQAQTSSLNDRLQASVQDSTRYAAVLQEKKQAEAQRDSVLRQLTIIRSIDNNRFIWPHILDEVSAALPPYTWLTSVSQTSAPPAPPSAQDAKGKGKDTTVAPEIMKFRIVGNTVDIQAMTRFMKFLEGSPFIQNVNLNRSELVVVDGKEVTQFELGAEYQQPDSSAIRTRPVTLSVR
jgi:type IV pilus assembly protein PilN